MQNWKLLAQEEQGDRIQQCPVGHIHLDYGNVTIRFQPEAYLAFATYVAQAAAALSGHPLAGLPESRPRARFSKN